MALLEPDYHPTKKRMWFLKCNRRMAACQTR